MSLKKKSLSTDVAQPQEKEKTSTPFGVTAKRSVGDLNGAISSSPTKTSPLTSLFRRASSSSQMSHEYFEQMHAKNQYLKVCDFLSDFPEVTSRIVAHLKPKYLVDVMLMLHVRGVMEKAIFQVASIEAQSNAERGLVSETFRTESPAILMAGALLSLDTLLEFKHKFVSEAAVKVMKRVSWNPKAVLKICKHLLKYLRKMVQKMPEELVVLLKALSAASKAAKMHNVQAQIFFLRYICPALVQPGLLGGLEVVPEDMARSLMMVAKALQLIANKTDPKEGDQLLFPIKDDLRALYPVVDDIFATVNELARGAPSPPVEKQLVDPAKYIFVCLFQHSAKFEGESLAAWSKLVEELGSPEALQEEYRKSSV